MSLYHWNGSQLVPIDLTGSDIGADVYLCCPGPSLAKVDESKLHIPGAMVACMNTAYPRIARPDIWIGSDLPECFDPHLWFEPFRKVNRVPFADETISGRPLKTFPNSFFADLGSGDTLDILTKRDPDAFFVWPDSTLTFVLHVLFWMGTKRLFLVGCDFGGKDYYDDRRLPDDLRDENQRLYRNQANEVGRLAQAARPLGIHIVSCTANSKANEFIPYLPLDKALAQTAERTKIPNWKPRHVRDVERDRWSKRFTRTDEPNIERGVLVGVPGDQADLLDGWWKAYSGHNTLPVAFVDYGLPVGARKWCAAHGTVVDHQSPADVKGWFRKPFGILRSPFKVTLFLDVDCYPTGNVEGLMAAHEVGRVEVALDRYADHSERKFPAGKPLYDTGAIIIDWDSPALVDWAAATVIDRYDARGDQEVFSHCVLEKGWKAAALDPKAFDAWFALEGKPTPLLLHYCGEGGKDELRKRPAPTPAITTGRPRRTLISFWHGLGDNILCMPAIRKFKKETGDFIGLAMARCHAPAGLHDLEPAIDRIHYISTPWDHHSASGRDVGVCLPDTHREIELLADRHGYDEVKHLDMNWADDAPTMPTHKLLLAAHHLGVELHGDELRTSYAYDKELARAVLRGRGIKVPKEYVFFHGTASWKGRCISKADGERLCRGLGIDLPLVAVEDVLDPTRCPISAAAHLIAAASAVVVCDSVMYHLATAMGKRVDCVWYANADTRSIVRPLFGVRERVVIGRQAIEEIAAGKPLADFAIESVEPRDLFESFDGLNRPEPPRGLHTPGEREALLSLARAFRIRRVLEIGVADGWTSRYMLENCPWIEEYIGVDLPSGFTTHTESSRPGTLVHDPRFRLILDPVGSRSLAGKDMGKFDLIFIDGDHTEDGVRLDTDLATSLSHSSTIICWHDYANRDIQHDSLEGQPCRVTEYLDAEAAAGRLSPNRVGETSLCFQIGRLPDTPMQSAYALLETVRR